MSSSNNNSQSGSGGGGGGNGVGGSGGGASGNGGRQRIPQNRNPNQQHHSNRIYTRYNDQRPQYRKNQQQSSAGQQQRGSNGSNETLLSQRQRQRLASSMSIGDASKMCICCWHELRTYVYYSCAHYVCLNCSIKLRVLCEKIDCPVCRQESQRVLCTKNALEAVPADAASSTIQVDKLIDRIGEAGRLSEPANAVAAGVYFDDEQIRAECEQLMASRCSVCETAGGREQFRSIDELDKHMRKVHHRYFCELCIENLKLFPFERKHYDREGLAQHKRVGDKDDFSFKGHPLCKFFNIYCLLGRLQDQISFYFFLYQLLRNISDWIDQGHNCIYKISVLQSSSVNVFFSG